MSEMIGRRILDGQWFDLRDDGLLQPGDYGREHITKMRDGQEVTVWEWFVRCPDGSDNALWVNEDDPNGNRHFVTEHEDGTISVSGSILGRITWHGYLECGVWRAA